MYTSNCKIGLLLGVFVCPISRVSEIRATSGTVGETLRGGVELAPGGFKHDSCNDTQGSAPLIVWWWGNMTRSYECTRHMQ